MKQVLRNAIQNIFKNKILIPEREKKKIKKSCKETTKTIWPTKKKKKKNQLFKLEKATWHDFSDISQDLSN